MVSSITDYLTAGEAYKPCFGPDGDRIACIMDRTGVPQAYLLDGDGARPRPLTTSDHDTTFAIFSPAGDELVVGEDRHGGTETQFYHYDLEDGSTTPLLDEKANYWWGGWSRDGERIAYCSNQRDGISFDVYVYDFATGTSERVYDSGGWFEVADWGPRNERLLLKRTRSAVNHDLYLLSLSDGEIVHLTPYDEPVEFQSPNWHPPTNSIYFVTDYRSETQYVARIDLETKEITEVFSDDWGFSGINVHRSGRFICGVNAEGYTELCAGRLTGPAEFDEIATADHPAGVMAEASFGPDGRRVALTLSSRVDGTNVHVFDLEDGTRRRWTDTPRQGPDTSRLVAPELIRYESHDGLEIPAFFSLPPDRDPDETVPVIVDVHGGPEDQRRPGFNDTVQFFLDNGYAVLEPNVRGSTGYGADYERLDDRHRRADAIADVGAAVEWLEAQDAVDMDRVVAHGSSYGGFVALAAAAEYPDAWAAVVEFSAIVNLVTYLENTSKWRREIREAEYGSPDTDREFLAEISPINNVEAITAPILAVHGTQDQRVPLDETRQLVAQAERNGVSVETLFLDDEGHLYKSLDARARVYRTMLDFLERTVA